MKNISIIGAGNVATHLSLALQKKGYKIVQVYSRTAEHAKGLANQLNVDFISDLNKLSHETDMFIISLKDDAIQTVLEYVSGCKQMVVHTAGSVGIDIFKGYVNNYGVLYPLQTFSKSKPVDISNVPFFIEGNNENVVQTVAGIAKQLSMHVYETDSQQRLCLHIAAVFACNFTNHMYALAEKLLGGQGLSWNILHPLIRETTDKILTMSPGDAQTGPAVRNDQKTIAKHIEQLNNYQDLQKIYSFVSQHIYHERKNNNIHE
jgi:predicted short-subunit dehydrogenase-like oxidoreductase (DUF2520 family)